MRTGVEFSRLLQQLAGRGVPEAERAAIAANDVLAVRRESDGSCRPVWIDELADFLASPRLVQPNRTVLAVSVGPCPGVRRERHARSDIVLQSQSVMQLAA